MQVNNVALTAGYSAILSLLDIDTNGPVAFSLSVGQTSSDRFNLYGTLDSAAVDNANAFLIGSFSGGATNLPKGIANQARRWPYLLIQRTSGTTAGSLFVAGNPATSPAVVSAAAPVVVGDYSALLTLTTLGAETVRIGTSRQMSAADSFDIYASDDAALSSLNGAFYVGRIYGGGGANVNNTVLVSGYNYVVARRATGSTAGNVLAAGVSPSSGSGGGTLNLTTLAVGNTAVSGPIGALSAAQTVDIYNSFLLTQTTAGVVPTLPAPTDTAAGKVALVMNNDTATQPVIMYGMAIGIGASQWFAWDGSAWIGGRNLTAGGNAFGSSLAFGTLDAASIRILQNGGVVIADDGTNTIVGATTGGRAVALQSGAGGIGLLPGTGPLNMGTDPTDKQTTIGSGTGLSPVDINAGTSGAAIASNATDHPTTVGSVTGASLTSVRGGTSGVALSGTGAGGITVTPGAVGTVDLLPRGAAAGDTATLRFRELAAGGTEAIGLKAPDALAASLDYTLPATAPSISGQRFTSTTTGVTSWTGAVYVEATNNTNQSIPDANVSTVVTGWTEVNDTANAFVPATGLFTVPITGYYVVTAEIEFTAIAAAVGTSFAVGVYIDGTARNVGREYVQVAAANVQRNPKVTTPPLLLTAGQVVAIRALQDGGSGANTLSGVALRNYLGIHMV